MHMEIAADLTEEKKLLAELAKKDDPESKRIKRFLDMPDLSRNTESPIHALIQRILNIPEFKDFDLVKSPEVVPYDVSFDVYGFPADHPARRPSDTYFIDDKNVLRTHTTVMWYYYLRDPEIKKRLEAGETLGFFSHGKVYRKDEIDRSHMNVFHQIDGGFVVPRGKKEIQLEDLKNVLILIAKACFGDDVKYKFEVDHFPYTDPSLQMDVWVSASGASPGEAGASSREAASRARAEGGGAPSESGRWVEVLGCGIMTDLLMNNLGLDPKKWSNWAFGFGLERLAIISMDLPDIRLLWSQDPRVKKQLKLGNKFKEVSKFPPITRDVSFVVSKTFTPNNYFDLIRDIGGDLVEQVELLDKYENEQKFGKDKMSYTYRIIYRSNERTLTTGEIDPIQVKIVEETQKQFRADIR